MHHPLPDMVLQTLAADLACQVDDLLADRTTVTLFRLLPGRRRFPITDTMLHIVTIGAGTVICAGPAQHPWAAETLAPMTPRDIFSQRGQLLIMQRLAVVGCDSFGPSPSYLCNPDTLRPAPPVPGLRLQRLEGQAIAALYAYEGLHMALSYYTQGDRPDVLASIAWDGNQLASVAACSADSNDLWQVGIDVLPPWRNRGLAKWLVHDLTRCILDHSRIPYYSCGLQNLASQRIATSLGYYPAWTSIASR